MIPPDSFDRIAGNTRSLVKPSVDDDTVRLIARALASAENPVAYVGGGIRLAQASEELREFVDQMGLPVAHSLMGKGAPRDDHPLVMGMTGFWGTELVNQSCLNADYILALGSQAIDRLEPGRHCCRGRTGGFNRTGHNQSVATKPIAIPAASKRRAMAMVPRTSMSCSNATGIRILLCPCQLFYCAAPGRRKRATGRGGRLTSIRG